MSSLLFFCKRLISSVKSTLSSDAARNASYPKKTVKIDRTLSRIKVWRKWFSLVGQAYNRSFLKSDKTNKNAEQMTTEGPAAVS